MVVNLINQYSATVAGGMFDGEVLAGQLGGGANRRRAAIALSRRGTLPLQEIMKTLNGATAPAAASKTLSRIEANEELGGVRVVETATLLDEDTAAADLVTVADDILSHSSTIGNSPPANLDGSPLGEQR